MAGRPHVVVVGAGIIGASIAWHLARAGARVTVVEAGEPGGVATRASWAWINATWGNPEPYFRLRVRSMAEWRRLEREVAGVRVAWVGGLYWELPPAQLEVFAAQHAAWGYDIRLVGRAEVQRIEPHLASPPALAVHAPAEGVVEPLATAQALLAAAQGLGAAVMAHTPARALALLAGRVTGVAIDAGRVDADEVVVAAGVGAPRLLATAGVALPMVASPALLVATSPHGKCLNGLVLSPAMELRQTQEGRLLAAGPFDDAAPGADAQAAAAALFAEMQGMVVSGAALSLEHHVIGRRPMLQDRFPAIGRADGIGGLYTAVTHSGVTLAPVIGQFVADELLTGQRDSLLAPYGLGRFG